MRLHWMLSICVKYFLICCILLPSAAFANVLTVTATSPFPKNVLPNTTTTSIYTVTNVTSKSVITAVNQSQFPADSGLSITASSCGNPMKPSESCTIHIKLDSGGIPKVISTDLKIWAKPSAQGIKTPINITTGAIITPTAGVNGSISPNTPEEVLYGGSAVFTATPNVGYSVNQWLLDGVAVQTGGASYTLSNITANHSVQVTFQINQNTVTPSAGANGAISPSTAQTVNYGGSIGFTATPAIGYGVYQWLVDGVSVQTGGTSYTLSNITADHAVSVTFQVAQFTIIPSAGSNGAISPFPPQAVSYNTSITFTAMPNIGYVVNEWLVDGVSAHSGGTSFTLSNITANHTVQVTFKIEQFTITPSAGVNGSISPSTVQTVNYDGSIGFTATPNTGYLVNEWLVDGVSVQTGGTNFTLSNITANHTVQVTLLIEPFAITPSAGVNGSISPSIVQTVNYGGSTGFTATPNTGYVVHQWTLDGTPVQTGGTTYTLSNVTADHTVAVTFQIEEFTVTPSAGVNGAISPSTAQSINYDGSIVFTATPNTGYLVNEWLVDGVSVQTGGTNFTLSNITANHTVQVTFQIEQFTVTPSAGTNGVISPSTAQTVNYGGSPGFTATPNTGYVVNQWTLDGTPVQTGGTSYVLSNVTANHAVQVTFQVATFTITPSAGTNGAVNPNTPQTVNYGGSTVVFTATPVANYSVNQWLLDGNLIQTGGTSYTLNNVTAGHTIEVTFKTLSGVALAVGENSVPGLNGGFVAVSQNAASSWATPTITGLAAGGYFATGSCTGGVSNACCAAAGVNGINGPSLVVSTDGGSTWTAITPAGNFATGSYSSVSCTGTGNTAICAAVGTFPVSPTQVAVSVNGGSAWSFTPITNAQGTLNSVSCTGSAPNAICVAAGQTNNTAPLLAVSLDGSATTWGVPVVSELPSAGILDAASCTGSGSTAVCIVAGQNAVTSAPLLVVSVNGGASWTNTVISGAPADGLFTGVSCSGTIPNAVCIAVGQNLTQTTPIIAVSRDGSLASWSYINSIVGSPLTGIFNSASCSGNAPSTVCVAAGQNKTTNTPLLAVSTDGARTWSVRSITGAPTTGIFNSTTCTGSTTTAVCIAAGQDWTAHAPLLASSSDGGNTWSVNTVTGVPASGQYFGTGATGGAFKKFIN